MKTNFALARDIVDLCSQTANWPSRDDQLSYLRMKVEFILDQHRPVSAASKDTTPESLGYKYQGAVTGRLVSKDTTSQVMIDIAKASAGFTNIESPDKEPGHNV